MIMLHGKPLATLRKMVEHQLYEYENLRKLAPHLFDTPATAARVEELLEAKTALKGSSP
jgi:hypothetical protein